LSRKTFTGSFGKRSNKRRWISMPSKILSEQMIISALKPGEELTTKEIAERLSENTRKLFRSEESLLASVSQQLEKLAKKNIVEKKYFGQNVWRLKK
jgi:ribosomal protein L16 Arg81 hydroxylase